MKLACQDVLVFGKDFKEKLENLEKYGFEGIEICDVGFREKYRGWKKDLERSKTKVSAMCLDPRFVLLSAKKEEREIAINDTKEIITIGKYLGASGVIVVPVYGQSLIPDLSTYKTTIELEKELLLIMLEDLAKHAEKEKVVILLEPLNRYETHFINRLEQAVEICKKIKSNYVKIIADFFHMNIEEADIEKSIKSNIELIKYIHLADSNRILPGYGHIDFKKYFSVLKSLEYNGYIGLECGITGNPEVELPKCVKYLMGL